MYQSGNKHKNHENRVSIDFVDVSIGKQKIKIMKILSFSIQKIVKITKARSLLANHDHFVLQDFFVKNVAYNEVHKNHKNQ